MNKNSKEYLEIKSALLNDNNIEKVVIDTSREQISITPRQDLSYGWMEEPLVNFKNKGNIKICNKVFKVINYIQNMDKVYELVIKEY